MCKVEKSWSTKFSDYPSTYQNIPINTCNGVRRDKPFLLGIDKLLLISVLLSNLRHGLSLCTFRKNPLLDHFCARRDCERGQILCENHTTHLERGSVGRSALLQRVFPRYICGDRSRLVHSSANDGWLLWKATSFRHCVPNYGSFFLAGH